MKTVIEMARDAGATDLVSSLTHPKGPTTALRFGLDNGSLERFAELVRADERSSWAAEMEAMERQVNILTDALAQERKQIANLCEEFARKWWKIHCDTNVHYSSTLKAHQDFCALQAAIRARGSNT